MKTSTSYFKKTGLCFILGMLFAYLIQSTALAQVNSINTGDRVKISASTVLPNSLVGTLYRITPTNIFLISNNEYVIIPLNSISQIDVSIGKKRNTGRGALLGLSSGAALGGFFGLAVYRECDDTEPFGCLFHLSKFESFTLGAGLGGISGLVLGTVIGTITKTDRWQGIPIEVLMKSPSVTSKKLSYSPVVNVKFLIFRNR